MNTKLPIEKKEIPNTFNQIAESYDFLNHLLSMGIDKLWRLKMFKALPKNEECKVLDLATGTGDVAIGYAKYNECANILGVDPAKKMMDVGEQKIEKLGLKNRISFKVGDGLDLPLNDKEFDYMTMAFGLRNLPNRPQGLSEIYRTLKPGGKAIILEFSIPKFFIIKWVYLLYFKYILPFVGGVISGNYKAYSYLNKSVEDFPSTDQIIGEMNAAGFSTQYQELTFGIATLYIAHKKA